MYIPFHDPLIIPLEGEYLSLSTDMPRENKSARATGVSARTSTDLLHWSESFPLLSATPESVKQHVNTDIFWALLMLLGEFLHSCSKKSITKIGMIGRIGRKRHK